MFAARAQHVTTIIEPALERGEWVLCDRFSDASFAYQGYGRGLPVATVEMLERLTHPTLSPDLTILLDVDPKVGLERARERGDLDRFEVEASAFFERVREGYLLRARDEPERWRIIDARRSLPEVEVQIKDVLTDWLASSGRV
jgi:dTMP kinase